MIKNYINIAIHNLKIRRKFVFLNILGLSIGFACFIIILLYTFQELSYDKFHENSKRTYRVINNLDFGSVFERSTSSPFPLGPTIKNEYPQIIENAARFFNLQEPQKHFYAPKVAKGFNEKRFFFADPAVFDIFDFPIKEKLSGQLLSKPMTAVLTESTAKRYFGNSNPLGQEILYDGDVPVKVVGIIEDVPFNSHVKFDILISFSSLVSMHPSFDLSSWVWNPCWTYLLLKEGKTPKELKVNLSSFVDKHFSASVKEILELDLQPLEDIHLKSHLDYEIEKNGNIKYIRILISAGIFLFLIAIVNYINLFTASAAERAREVAVKKIVGANRIQISIQIIIEAIILNILALGFSLIWVELFVPFFKSYINPFFLKEMRTSPLAILLVVTATFLTGILSGLYPAMKLSNYTAVKIFNNKNKYLTYNSRPRKTLVIFQFFVSILLISGTISIFKQLNFIKKSELGFNYKNIMIIPVSQSPVAENFIQFREELMRYDEIENVTASDYVLGVAYNNHQYYPENAQQSDRKFHPTLIVREGFLQTFGIKVIKGQGISECDSNSLACLLVNEAMVNHYGWDIDSTIGKVFTSHFDFSSELFDYDKNRERICGVINDFNTRSLHEQNGPLVVNIKRNAKDRAWLTRFLAIKLRSVNKETVGFIRKSLEKYNKNRPLEYFMLEDKLAEQYKEENVLWQIMLIFTSIAILIALLGIYGLTSYLSLHRTKEIGIRKTLGASTIQILGLLGWQYTKLVLVANLIAWPIAYGVIYDWLGNFAYKTSPSVLILALASFISFVLAYSIILIQTLKSAMANPIDSLRYE